jgi:hypothetical protein
LVVKLTLFCGFSGIPAKTACLRPARDRSEPEMEKGYRADSVTL